MYLISDGGMNTNILDTIEAVMLTKNVNYLDGVKLDIRNSLDNIIVISRYEELDKFTYGKGNISEYNYCFLKKIKFPSHIFKYYIPTLEEILKKYDKRKIIVLEIYNINNLDNLMGILLKYSYKYYFLSKNSNILDKLKELEFNKIGKIISNNEIINNNYSNTFVLK